MTDDISTSLRKRGGHCGHRKYGERIQWTNETLRVILLLSFMNESTELDVIYFSKESEDDCKLR